MLNLIGRFVLEKTNPRPNENAKQGYFLKLAISGDNIESNEALFLAIKPKLPSIQLNSPIFGEATLNSYFTATINPFGEQKPHTSVGWYGAFHQDNHPSNPLDENITNRAQEIADSGFTVAFSIDPQDIAMVSTLFNQKEINLNNYTQAVEFVGRDRDTLLSFELPSEAAEKVLAKAKYIFGKDFKQTNLQGQEIPFHITIAQASLKEKLTIAPLTPAAQNYSQKSSQPLEPAELATPAVEETKMNKRRMVL